MPLSSSEIEDDAHEAVISPMVYDEWSILFSFIVKKALSFYPAALDCHFVLRKMSIE